MKEDMNLETVYKGVMKFIILSNHFPGEAEAILKLFDENEYKSHYPGDLFQKYSKDEQIQLVDIGKFKIDLAKFIPFAAKHCLLIHYIEENSIV